MGCSISSEEKAYIMFLACTEARFITRGRFGEIYDRLPVDCNNMNFSTTIFTPLKI